MFEKYFKDKKLVCFDFDGLLIDTEPLHHKAYIDVLEDLCFPLTLDFETYCKIAHSKNRNLFEETVKTKHPHFNLSWETLRAHKTKRYRALLEEGMIKPMEGAELLVSKIQSKGIKSCIVTNSYRKDVETISETLTFIKSFPLILAREDYPLPKPSADGYLKALSYHNINALDAIGLEDSEKGMDALKAASIFGLLINKDSQINSLSLLI